MPGKCQPLAGMPEWVPEHKDVLGPGGSCRQDAGRQLVPAAGEQWKKYKGHLKSFLCPLPIFRLHFSENIQEEKKNIAL